MRLPDAENVPKEKGVIADEEWVGLGRARTRCARNNDGDRRRAHWVGFGRFVILWRSRGVGVMITYRGLYLVGRKRDQRILAVHVVNSAGSSTTLRLREYISRRIEPEYKTLPWQEDLVFRHPDPKAQSN